MLPALLTLFLVQLSRFVPAAAAPPFTTSFVQSYAPIVYLCPTETFLPSAIEYALPNEQVLENGSSATSTNGGAQPSPLTASNLNFQSSSDASNSYLTTKQALGCDTCVNPPFLRGVDPSKQAVPVYAIIIPRNASATSVFYWFFFPFNYGKSIGLCLNNLPAELLSGIDSQIAAGLEKLFGGSASPSVAVTGPDARLVSAASSNTQATSGKCEGYEELIGNHVGDWEHVEITFDTTTSPPQPKQARLSQHNGGANYAWGDPALRLSGTHPIVYSANGSHANYANIGQHEYGTMTILDNVIGLIDTTGQGIKWDTSQQVVLATWSSSNTYTGTQNWLGWTGFWGNQQSGCTSNPINTIVSKATGECPLTNGPKGPAQQMGPNFP